MLSKKVTNIVMNNLVPCSLMITIPKNIRDEQVEKYVINELGSVLNVYRMLTFKCDPVIINDTLRTVKIHLFFKDDPYNTK